MDIGPVSLFDNVKSNKPADCMNFDFDDFVEIMSTYSRDKFSCKSDAPLICVTEFKDGRRSKANATQSGMVVLDIDDHLTVGEVLDNLRDEGIAALLCSTASHRDDHHKFRVFVPLLEIADYDDHVLAWHVLNHAVADGKADPSKIGWPMSYNAWAHLPTEFCKMHSASNSLQTKAGTILALVFSLHLADRTFGSTPAMTLSKATGAVTA